MFKQVEFYGGRHTWNKTRTKPWKHSELLALKEPSSLRAATVASVTKVKRTIMRDTHKWSPKVWSKKSSWKLNHFTSWCIVHGSGATTHGKCRAKEGGRHLVWSHGRRCQRAKWLARKWLQIHKIPTSIALVWYHQQNMGIFSEYPKILIKPISARVF